MNTVKPLVNDANSLNIGRMMIENGTDRVAICGSIDLTRDEEGLERARALKTLIDIVVQELEADKKLPDKLAPPDAAEAVRDPSA